MEASEDLSKMNYDYIVENLLDKELPTSELAFDNVFLCAYYVNTSAKYPFLQYLLCSHEFGNKELHFPRLSVWEDKRTLQFHAIMLLSALVREDDDDNFASKVAFSGFFECQNNLYLFYDLTATGVPTTNDLYAVGDAELVLIDEIVNHRRVCHRPISQDVTTFFVQNDSLMFLYDDENVAYEVPVSGFVAKPTESQLKFTCMFGESPRTKTALLGPYFYFTDFDHAVTQSTGGIVRFALFLGQTKLVLNAPDDPLDKSMIKQEKLAEAENRLAEALTYRISDHDGVWAQTYDSVYLAEMDLDNGLPLEDTPMIVLKDYKQQLPLSWHLTKTMVA